MKSPFRYELVEAVDDEFVNVVTASVCLRDDHPCELTPPKKPRYRIFQQNRFIGWCRDVEGLPESWPGYAWPPVTLLGCDDPERVRETTTLWKGLRALDDTGRVMAEVPLVLEITEVRQRDDGLADVVLDQSGDHHPPHWRDRPPPAARPVWDVWRRGLPREPGLWAPFGTEARQVWLDLTYVGHETRRPPERSGGTYHLHGGHVTDLPGLHLALSEAFVGPGNYFGRCYDSFRDCLGGGWGVVANGSTLVWHDAEVANEAIPEPFLDIVNLLRGNGVTVELDSTSDDWHNELRELVERWQPGWAKTGGRDYRCILADAGPHEVDRTAAQMMVSPSVDWLVAVTHSAAEVTETLERHGMELRSRETFLRRDLAGHPMPPVPEGVEVQVFRTDIIEVRVLRNRARVAGGRMAVVGTDAVPREVTVVSSVQRRGLGGLVMGALVREAVADGATTGLAFASEDGSHLLRALGWETVADVVIAMNDVWRKDLRRRADLGRFVERWQKGWRAAEQLPRPPKSHHALRMRLGESHHLVVTDDATDRFHLKEIALADRRDVTLTIPTHSPGRAIDRAHELDLRLLPPRKLMTRALAGHPAPAPPDGYTLTVTRTRVIEARVTHDGVEVARGRMSVAGEDAVALDISTDLAHRRLGLGSAVLGRLVREAEKDGATTGLLCSSEFGLVFFRSLGWQDEADVVTAYKS